MTKAALVVDDSLVVRKLVTTVLKKAGFETHEAANGKEALDKIEGCSPAVIITDINMPVMDGLDFIRAVRAQVSYKFTPIICLTTEAEDSMKEEGRAAGATGWVVKPFDAERLMRAVQKVVA